MHTRANFLCGLLAACAQVSNTTAAEPAARATYRAGDFVVVIRRAELRLENKTVDTVDAGVLLGVDQVQVQGQWLWVTSAKSGWLNTRYVMPATQSIEYFTNAIRRTPTNGRLFARRGLARALNEDFQAALKDYNEALRLRPAEAVYYGDRGCIFLALGDYDRAISDFSEEIKRIGTESDNKRAIRLEWLNQRISDARAAKAQDSTLTLGNPK